jgi:hypothetical protein
MFARSMMDHFTTHYDNAAFSFYASSFDLKRAQGCGKVTEKKNWTMLQ